VWDVEGPLGRFSNRSPPTHPPLSPQGDAPTFSGGRRRADRCRGNARPPPPSDAFPGREIRDLPFGGLVTPGCIFFLDTFPSEDYHWATSTAPPGPGKRRGGDGGRRGSGSESEQRLARGTRVHGPLGQGELRGSSLVPSCCLRRLAKVASGSQRSAVPRTPCESGSMATSLRDWDNSMQRTALRAAANADR
jgi:hypothetical protein